MLETGFAISLSYFLLHVFQVIHFSQKYKFLYMKPNEVDEM